jgi:hypothetical protein
MDVSELVQRYGEVPAALQLEADEVWNHLQKQSEHIISAKATANFGVDDENTKLAGYKVHKGLIVGVKPGYQISAADSWIHPNLNQCRSLFDGGRFEEYDHLPSTNCSAGIYNTQKVNAVGDVENNPHTIVDLHLEEAGEARVSWNGKSVESVYSTGLRDKTLAKVQEVARRFGAQEKIRSDFTNILYRGRNMYYFYNNAYKGEGLVLASPLTGYTLVNATDHAADYMSEQMIDIPNLDEKHIESLYSKAKWNTPELINTFVARQSFSSTSASYRMEKASFSDTPVVKFMTPSQINKMTPSHMHVKNLDQRVHDFFLEDKLHVPMTSNVIQQLLDMKDVEFINPKLYKDGKLILPRNIVNRLN